MCRDGVVPPMSQHPNWKTLGHPLSQVSGWGGIATCPIPWENQDNPISQDLKPCLEPFESQLGSNQQDHILDNQKQERNQTCIEACMRTNPPSPTSFSHILTFTERVKLIPYSAI